MTVGRIYVPPQSGDEVVSQVVERDDFYTLQPGGMALVLSREHVGLNSEIGGFVFPKNGDFALKGLLFTNFGHIDPGFAGHLRFTVINMGRKEFTLRYGDRIAAVTLFRLTSPTDAYLPKHASSCETQARVLARDFLNIDSRVIKTTKELFHDEFQKKDRTSIWVNVAASTLLVVATVIGFSATFYSVVGAINEKIVSTTVELHKLQLQLDALKRADQPPIGQKK